ncbi:Ribosomal protein L10e/L16 [Penicillium canescens]|uniref:Ribosomal protein L10e/L16 n=1 Tax=Penicillium canescens TaxID=5083 RepID=A0AAD6N8R4_PENCN|nr:Ribosomal protein L10e/L16 [Penicillium canescens]KAJ6043061.1 Ribosomal protein L10e/L16 [Penicillium canescens]KAJ6054537.1 Ribosomal protein L10e/L16 [Penicillium canescens]KAJ6073480.1 Ribosomal protein L10e/L16 [Penicillium canescens]
MSRLLNCTGSCMQDPSMLLVISAVLMRILTFYGVLYESQIGRVPTDTRDGECSSSQHSDSNHGISTVLSLSERRGPLVIPNLNLPRDTETKMKTQPLLCELQTLSGMLGLRAIQNAEMAEYDPKHILYKLGNLKRILSVVCTE